MSTTTTPPRRPARANTAWWWALLIWTVSAGTTLGALTLFQVQWSLVQSPPGQTVAYDALTPTAHWLLGGMLLAIWGVATVRITRTTGRRVLAPVLSAALLLVSLVAGLLASENARPYAAWEEEDRIAMADGCVYVALSRRGGVYFTSYGGLGRVRNAGLLTETVKVLEERVTEPGSADFVLTPKGLNVPAGPFLVALPNGSVAMLEYDWLYEHLATVLIAPAEDGSAWGIGAFALFDADDAGSATELDRLIAWIDDAELDEFDVAPDGLATALEHPSPWVRASATRVRAAMDRRRAAQAAGQGR